MHLTTLRSSTGLVMASLLQSGLDLSPIIDYQFLVDDFQRGFNTMGSGQSGKVLLDGR